MQLTDKKIKFDLKEVKQLLQHENKFITNLFSIVALPQQKDLEEDNDEQDNGKHQPHIFNGSNKKTRAKSLQELEERLKAMTGNKKKLSYKEKLAKKGLKNRMKKKTKQDERNAKRKLERAEKLTPQTEVKTEIEQGDTKQVFNSENKLVYSKINFPNAGKKKHKKVEKDPKKLLEKLNKEKLELDKLEQQGNIQEAVQIKEKKAWKNALAKAEGQKIKDDPMLLKKSVKKKEQKVRSSKKKWEARIQGVEKAKAEKQKKRNENLSKRKKGNKVKKIKAAVKRGAIIPGY